MAALSALVFFSWAGSASAASGYSVTYVARVCPSYADIYANRARNDIQESLKDLGPDSQYSSGDFRVNPDAESQPPQDKCKPLVNWRFTLGTGFESRAVTGPWGSLSRVTDPYTTFIQTKARTPLLNQNGDPIEHEKIAGAVTVELTSEQVQQASNPDSLWARGDSRRSCAGWTVPGTEVRVWGAEVRGRRAQWRQCRVHFLADRRQARVLLRPVCVAASDRGHDHD